MPPSTNRKVPMPSSTNRSNAVKSGYSSAGRARSATSSSATAVVVAEEGNGRAPYNSFRKRRYKRQQQLQEEQQQLVFNNLEQSLRQVNESNTSDCCNSNINNSNSSSSSSNNSNSDSYNLSGWGGRSILPPIIPSGSSVCVGMGSQLEMMRQCKMRRHQLGPQGVALPVLTRKPLSKGT